MPLASAVVSIAAPARRVYAVLTDFGRVHEVIDGLDRVALVAPGRLRVHPTAGRAHHAVVVENVVDRRLAWTPEGGEPGMAPAFTIDPVGDDACRVTLAVTGMPDQDAAAVQGHAERTLAAVKDAAERPPEG